MYPGYPGSSFDEPFEDIFPCRSARSPRVELTPYLTNSFDDNLAKIKIKLNILEENYKFINEFLQKAEGKFLRCIYNILIYKTYLFIKNKYVIIKHFIYHSK